MPSGCGPSQQFIRITKGSAIGLIIGLIPKSAFTSIRGSLYPEHAEKVWRPEVKDQQLPIRIYIRQPLRRMVSAFRFLSMGRPGIVPDSCTFEQFVDIVLDPEDPGNSHWLPQVAWFDEYNVTEIYQLERIEETWPPEIALGYLNRSPDSTPLPALDYRLNDINDYYADDIRAWNKRAEVPAE